MTASFNLQESIYYNLEMGCNVFVAFLDVQKAFDSVWHDALFVKLHSLGIAGKIWNVLVNSYTDLKCNIRMNGAISKPLIIKRGVRQGGVIPLSCISSSLTATESATAIRSGAHVCSIPAGNPTLADDNIVHSNISSKPSIHDGHCFTLHTAIQIYRQCTKVVCSHVHQHSYCHKA